MMAAVSLGPDHRKAWTASPSQVNERVFVLPSQKNRCLQDFLENLPHGLINVRDLTSRGDSAPSSSSSCIVGKPAAHTPVGPDRDSVTVTLQDLQSTETVEVIFSGQSARNFPTVQSSALLYIYGGRCSVTKDNDGVTIECSDDCSNLRCYIINRWLHKRIEMSSETTSDKPTATTGNINSNSSTSKPISTFVAQSVSASPLKSPSAYNYHGLGKLDIGAKLNISGVVKFFKPCYRSKGSDYCSSFVLVDSSQIDGVNVMSFHKNQDELPNIRRTGDIVLLRRAMIGQFNGYPQVIAKFFSSFHIFDGTLGEDEPIVPYNSSRNASLYNKDKEMVAQLRKWKKTQPFLDPSYTLCRLENIEFGVQFNLVCQVVSVVTLVPDKVICFSVCDGTRPSLKCAIGRVSASEYGINQVANIDEYESFAVDIFLLHEPSIQTCQIRPGQYIYLNNILPCPQYATNPEGETVTIACLQVMCEESTALSYSILQESDPEMRTLKLSLEAALSTTQDPFASVTAPSSSVTFTPYTSDPLTTIADLMECTEFPKTHHCLVRTIGIDAQHIGDIVHLRCFTCNTRYPPAMSVAGENLRKPGTECPVCARQQSFSGEKTTVPTIEYAYELVLTVMDQTGELLLLVADDEAEAFFGAPPPSNFYIDESAGVLARGQLEALFGCDPFSSSMEVEPPLMDCCIYASLTDQQPVYRLHCTYINCG